MFRTRRVFSFSTGLVASAVARSFTAESRGSPQSAGAIFTGQSESKLNQLDQRVSALEQHERRRPVVVCGPSGVACDPNFIYVAEGGNHRVQKLNKADGSPVSSVGSHGTGQNHMWCPQGLAVAKRFTISDNDTVWLTPAHKALLLR